MYASIQMFCQGKFEELDVTWASGTGMWTDSINPESTLQGNSKTPSFTEPSYL